jgi:hypothetical protein
MVWAFFAHQPLRAESEKLRGFGGRAPNCYSCKYEKQQLANRLAVTSVYHILEGFNQGQIDAQTAAERLSISRARLYQLRHQWLRDKAAFQLRPSGGDHHPVWPKAAHEFLTEFLPHCRPLNFALMADELTRRLGFGRSRAAVAAYVRTHFIFPSAFCS